MKEYIQLLQNKRLQATTPSYWNYSISGNIIELQIIPSLKKDPEKYRIGVIQAGSVIQDCRLSFMKKANKPLIQIFPSIMENELIAFIRFNSSRSKVVKKPDLQSTLQSKSKKNPLKVDQSLISIEEIPKSTDIDFIDIPKDSYALCTRSENPFSWLNVGYQAEILQHELKQKNGFDSCTSYILKNKHEQLAISSLLKENIMPQIIIFHL